MRGVGPVPPIDPCGVVEWWIVVLSTLIDLVTTAFCAVTPFGLGVKKDPMQDCCFFPPAMNEAIKVECRLEDACSFQ